MPAIPQELIDNIVCRLDIPSLKACALAGSLIRVASQRILLRSLTLRVSDGTSRRSQRPANHAAACELLSESPHIAHYITHLNVQLLNVCADPSAVDILEEVFARLTSVRHCTLKAEPNQAIGEATFRWVDVMPATFTDFLSLQQLQELRVERISAIPLPVFSRLLGSTPLLSLLHVSPEALEYPSGRPLYHPTVETLILNSECKRVVELLCCPPFKSYTATLRHLSIMVYEHIPGSFLSSVAPTLRSIRFSFSGASPCA